MIGTELFRDRHPGLHGVHADDRCRAHQFGPGNRTKAYGAECKDGNRIADLHLPAFGPRKARRHDVGAHQDLFVAEVIGDRTKVGYRIGHQNIFGLAAVDRIAQAPAAHRLEAMRGARPILRVAAAQRCIAVSARRYGTGDNALPFLITGDGRPQLFDHSDRLVANGQAFFDRVFALQDVNVGTANRRRRDFHQRIGRPHIGHRLLVENNPTRLGEYSSLHIGHGIFLGGAAAFAGDEPGDG